jgi:hypothetical protein
MRQRRTQAQKRGRLRAPAAHNVRVPRAAAALGTHAAVAHLLSRGSPSCRCVPLHAAARLVRCARAPRVLVRVRACACAWSVGEAELPHTAGVL